MESACSRPAGIPCNATTVDSGCASAGENGWPLQACEPGPSVQALSPMKYCPGVVPLPGTNSSESERNVEKVPRTSGAVRMIVRSRGVVCEKRYQSTPCSSRFSGSNASAGLKNLRAGIEAISGAASRLIARGAMSLGSSTSNGRMYVVSGASPNTPGPKNDNRVECATGVTQNFAVEKPVESRVRVTIFPGKGKSNWVVVPRNAMKIESTPTP